MTKQICNWDVCICCGRRSDNLAVGTQKKFGAYCFECGPDMAKIALALYARDFDAVEKRAAMAVAEAAGGPIEVPAEEAPAFILWVIENYAENMRKQFEAGAPPF